MIQQTLEKLSELKLYAIAQGLKTQLEDTTYCSMPFEERFALLIEQQWLAKQNYAYKRKLRLSGITYSWAALENVDFSANRDLKKEQFIRLCSGNWLSQAHNLLLTGPTGTGKTYLASVIAHQMCRIGKVVAMTKTNDLIGMLHLRKNTGTNLRNTAYLLKADLVIIDEWMREVINHSHARELLDFIDSRYQTKSLLFISQIPVNQWHERFTDPTIADAILDRIVHNSYRIQLKGDSMRKIMKPTLQDLV